MNSEQAISQIAEARSMVEVLDSCLAPIYSVTGYQNAVDLLEDFVDRVDKPVDGREFASIILDVSVGTVRVGFERSVEPLATTIDVALLNSQGLPVTFGSEQKTITTYEAVLPDGWNQSARHTAEDFRGRAQSTQELVRLCADVAKHKIYRDSMQLFAANEALKPYMEYASACERQATILDIADTVLAAQVVLRTSLGAIFSEDDGMGELLAYANEPLSNVLTWQKPTPY